MARDAHEDSTHSPRSRPHERLWLVLFSAPCDDRYLFGITNQVPITLIVESGGIAQPGGQRARFEFQFERTVPEFREAPLPCQADLPGKSFHVLMTIHRVVDIDRASSPIEVRIEVGGTCVVPTRVV